MSANTSAEPETETTCRLAFRVEGLDCPDCARSIEAVVARVPGVVSADLNFASGTLLVDAEQGTDPSTAISRQVESAGHSVAPLQGERPAPGPQLPWRRRYRAEIAVYGSGALTALGLALTFAHSPALAADIAFALAIVLGGALVAPRALMALRARTLDMNVLMTIAVFGAAAMGDWGEAASVTFLFAVGGYLEARALERTRRSIRDLMALAPQVARVRRGAAVVEVPLAQVAVGERVVVRPGERVAVDGEVVEGVSAVDEAAITGESIPADKQPGDLVYAGSLNTSGLIEVVASAESEGSTLRRIVRLVEEAQATKAPVERTVDRFARWYTPAAVGLAVAIAVVPPLVAAATHAAWGDPQEWFSRALVVLVVACPCALVVSTPVAVVSALTRAARDGVLVKGGAYLEAAAGIRAVAVDKTGTLTLGSPEVQTVHAENGDADSLLRRAASLEAGSAHPLARAVTRAADAAGFSAGVAADVRETPGRGVAGVLGDERLSLTSPGFAEEIATVSAGLADRIREQEALGRTVLVLVSGETAGGFISVADELRPGSAETVRRLREMGIQHVVMLTGDNERTAAALAASVGLTEHAAGLLPADKVAAVERLRQRYGPVLMVGDGVNDAPALATADVGVAMGAAGSDTALEVADVALMADDLHALPRFLALSRRTVRNITENVTFSVVVKAAVLILAVTGRASLWLAVFADTGVALLVILNGMRLLAPKR